jgi:hypothetical protein
MANKEEKLKQSLETKQSANKVDTRAEAVIARYPRNATYPADLSLVPREQRIITEHIQGEVRRAIPDDFSSSMTNMVLLAQLSADSMLAAENQVSYNEARATSPPIIDKMLINGANMIAMPRIRSDYAEGLAVGADVLKLMVAIDLKTAGLIMRTHAFQSRPQDLQDDIHALYEEVIRQQKPGDVMGSFNERTRVKMLDRAPGQGGLEAMLISKKADFATIQDRSIVLTVRDRFVIDVRKMPVKWRGQLRKLVSTWAHGNPVLEEPVEDASRNELYERILDLPNPDNPEQTLRTLGVEDTPFIHHFSTTMYGASAELTKALDQLEIIPETPLPSSSLNDIED